VTQPASGSGQTHKPKPPKGGHNVIPIVNVTTPANSTDNLTNSSSGAVQNTTNSTVEIIPVTITTGSASGQGAGNAVSIGNGTALGQGAGSGDILNGTASANGAGMGAASSNGTGSA